MPTNISYSALLGVIDLIEMMKRLDLMSDYLVTWERRPSMMVTTNGELEFEHPEELYACCITFWGSNDTMMTDKIAKVRFNVTSEE